MDKIAFIETNKIYHKKYTHKVRLSHIYSNLMTPQFAASFGDSYQLLTNLDDCLKFRDEYTIARDRENDKFTAYHHDNRLLFKLIKKLNLKWHHGWDRIFTIYYNGEPEVLKTIKKLKQFSCHVHQPSNPTVVKLLLENKNIDVRKQLPHGNMRYKLTIEKRSNWDHIERIGTTIFKVIESRGIKIPGYSACYVSRALQKKFAEDIRENANLVLTKEILIQITRHKPKDIFGYYESFSMFLENEQELSYWLLMLGDIKVKVTEIKLLSEIENKNAET